MPTQLALRPVLAHKQALICRRAGLGGVANVLLKRGTTGTERATTGTEHATVSSRWPVAPRLVCTEAEAQQRRAALRDLHEAGGGRR